MTVCLVLVFLLYSGSRELYAQLHGLHANLDNIDSVSFHSNVHSIRLCCLQPHHLSARIINRYCFAGIEIADTDVAVTIAIYLYVIALKLFYGVFFIFKNNYDRGICCNGWCRVCTIYKLTCHVHAIECDTVNSPSLFRKDVETIAFSRVNGLAQGIHVGRTYSQI